MLIRNLWGKYDFLEMARRDSVTLLLSMYVRVHEGNDPTTTFLSHESHYVRFLLSIHVMIYTWMFTEGAMLSEPF